MSEQRHHRRFWKPMTRRSLLKGSLAAGLIGPSALLAACRQSTGGSSPTQTPASSGAAPSAPSTPAVIRQSGQLAVFVGKNTTNPQGQTQLFKAIEDAFHKKYPNVTIAWDTYASADEELTKIQTSAASGVGPDVFEFGSTLVPTAFATGAFETFTPDMWQAIGGQEQFFAPQLKMSGPSPDKYIAVPEYANTFALLYNTAMFKQAGLSAPPKSWSEFVEFGKRLTDPSKNVWGTAMAYADSYDPWHWVWLYTEQLGGSLVKSDGTGNFTSPEVIETVTFWLDLMAKHQIVSKASATYKAADALHAFAAQQAAMLVMVGPGLIPTLNQSAVAQSYAYAANPTIPFGRNALPPNGKPAQAFVAGQYLCIFKGTKNKELALELIKTIISPEIQYQIWKLYGNLPVVAAAFDQYAELKQEPWTTFRSAIENAYPTPFLGSWGQLEVAIGHAVSKIAAQIATTGSYTADDLQKALEAANTEYNASLK